MKNSSRSFTDKESEWKPLYSFCTLLNYTTLSWFVKHSNSKFSSRMTASLERHFGGVGCPIRFLVLVLSPTSCLQLIFSPLWHVYFLWFHLVWQMCLRNTSASGTVSIEKYMLELSSPLSLLYTASVLTCNVYFFKNTGANGAHW